MLLLIACAVFPCRLAHACAAHADCTEEGKATSLLFFEKFKMNLHESDVQSASVYDDGTPDEAPHRN